MHSLDEHSHLGPDRPFPGLRPYDFADQEYFHGREDQIYALYRLLDRSRFTAVVGTSGSGKSSLVRAGLLPLLKAETEEQRARRWHWFELRPGNTPFARLAETLVGVQPETEAAARALHEVRRKTIEVLLRRSSFGLRQALRELQEFQGYSILVVVDQFEEIFRYADLADSEDTDPALRETRLSQAAAFVQLLMEASRDPSRPIHVMLTMRSDYLGDCARFHDLPEAVAANQFLVPSLTRDQREQAIRGPIETAGATIESGLVQRLLNDSGAGNDQLPVLQHALMCTWNEAGHRQSVSADEAASRASADGRPSSRHLTIRDYEAIGTLANALSQHAGAIMAELDGLELAVQQTFRALAELDRDNRAIRRPLPYDRLRAETGVPEGDLRRVLDRFRQDDCSFLVPPHPQPLEGSVIDIGHEALIRRWDRMSVNKTGTSDDQGWLWAEAEDGNIYRGLLALASDSDSATLPLGQVESRWRWWRAVPRTDAWAARYGGHLGKVQRLFENSRQALRAERDRQQQEERERRRFTQLAVTAAISFGALAVIATGALGYALYQKTLADEAVIETKASAFWNGLQLWNDPLRERDVATLWKLTQEDDDVRVAFVRRLANSRDLIAQFGFKPQPIARAIGLRWPDEAREIAEESVAHLASGQFDPKIAQPFELVSYTRALAALEQLLDRATLEAGTRRIASAINDLAGAPEFTDQQLWALAEMVGVFAVRFKTDSIEPASERLREIIGSAEPSGSAGWALGRAIEVMAPTLEAEERSRALQYLVPLLGQNTDSWAAKAAPRALTALLPKLDPSQLDTALSGVPPAIAKASRGDSSYLLTLVQVAEKLARMGDQTAIAAFRRALTRQFTRPNDRLQLAALARATVPLLAQFADGRETLTSVIAEFVLVPDDFGVGLDTQEIFTRRLRAQRELRQALVSLDDQSKGRPSQDVLQTLHREWTTEPPPSARVDPYRRAAQVRLMALLAPSLAPDSVSIALKDLLAMLPRTGDYLAREAISRALVGLAPKLSDAEREEALTAAKDALAKTGSTEEATAWAEAIAALLPDDPRAATAEIVEALKYPTATETPTVQLLEALATPWGEEHETIAGKMLSDQTVLDWLEKRLPEGHSLAEPPNAPADLQFESTDPGQG